MSKLPIPDGVLKQHTIILGKTGAGKSSVARLLIEHILEPRRGPAMTELCERVTIIDPKGDWWGIKSSASGRDGGLPVAIFGGEHAEVPITPNSGAAVAKIATETSVPVLIDLKGWMPADKVRFFLGFAPVYYNAKGPRFLMIDEAHQFAPKGKIPDPQVGKMLHWANLIAGEGRGAGITLIAASQRPQKVHNDFLTQCETLIAMRVVHPADLRAFREWIEVAGDPAVGKEVMATVAGLQKGQAWVWSPEIGFGPNRVSFPKYWTYDSFKPQDPGPPPKGWHEVDLGTLREQFAEEIRQAEQNDPKLLHKRIKELEVKLAAASQNAIPDFESLQSQEKVGFERGVEASKAATTEAITVDRQRVHERLSPLIGVLDGLRSNLVDYCNGLLTQPPPLVIDVPYVARVQAAPQRPTQADRNRAHEYDTATNSPARVVRSKPQGTGQTLRQKVLNGLAWLEAKGIERPARAVVGVAAGVKGTGGYFENTIGAMRTEGLVEYPEPGTIVATAKGRDLADRVDASGEVYERWLDILSGLKRSIVDKLLEVHPRELTREELGHALGKTGSGGYFENTLGKLRTMGAIDYPRPGSVALTRNVMP